MLKTPYRRLRTLARTALLMCVLFLVTVLSCTVIFVLSSTAGAKILSPITHASSDSSNTEATIQKIKNFCQNNHISCQSVTQTDNETIQITLDTGATVFLSVKKDIDKQLASLQQVVTQLTIKGKQLKKLDFRFDNVVVSF